MSDATKTEIKKTGKLIVFEGLVDSLLQAYAEKLEARLKERGIVTYLTQDFSLMRRLNPGDKNSKLVRYDYVVRERELTKQESRNRDALASSLPKSPYYATRLNILRHLTGERDLHTAREWLAHLTNNQARFDVEGAKSLWMKSAWRGGFDWETDSWGPR